MHVLKDNELVMISDDCGDMPEGRHRLGLYYRDVRYLSIFELLIAGEKPRLLSSSSGQNYVCDVQMANPTIELPNGGAALARTVSIHRSRVLKDGLHEVITFYNHNTFPVPLQVTLSLGADFCDIFEVRGSERSLRGTLMSPVSANSGILFEYLGLDRVRRRVEVIFKQEASRVQLEEEFRRRRPRRSTFLPEAIDTVVRAQTLPPRARATWDLNLSPRRPFSLSFHILVGEGGVVPGPRPFDSALASLKNSYEDWLSQCTVLETDNEFFNQLLRRSALDLRLLMEETPQGPVPVAGIPWFSCISGRDSLITSLQTLMLNPEIARATLCFLAEHQGKKVDHWRDEEPGKIVHEIRKGEMANSGEIPHAAYYGSVDATPLFLLVFAEAMKWLDDDRLFQELLPSVKKALEWMEHYGDLDGDSYIEYLSRSRHGLKEQAWKDSRGAISYADGTPVDPPVALVEVQGYAYKALWDLAELLGRKGEKALAEELRGKALTLRENFNRDFWVEDMRFLAQGLDSQKRPVAAVTSNPGHCLYCGIVDRDKARSVVMRLTSAEMASGWGIRTLSSNTPKFNPMSYHHGAIWPHDNSLIVVGIIRYNYHWEAEQIMSQLFQASLSFRYSRLPELFCGFSREREAYSVPAAYPVSCSPQAWAAGSTILLFQSMLGLEVDAAARRLYLHPTLPHWLREATVRNLRIGEGTVDLYFERRETETRFEIARNEAGVEVVIPPR